MWKTASVLVGIVLVLITLGIVMLASTSGVHGETQFGDASYFLKRQALALALAIPVFFVMARIDYRLWRMGAIPLYVVTVVLLIMALTPGIGVTIKGSSRWIRFGPYFNFQPSELAKMTVVIFLAWYMTRMQRRAGEFLKGLVVPLILLGMIAGLIFLAPDFGTTMLVGLAGMILMFVGGTRIGYLLVTGISGGALFAIAVMQDALRMRRVIAFLNPYEYARDEAYQLLNAIYAFVVGGPRGVGLGQSLQKRFYLPESHTDFIFAIIGEELGLTASLGVVLLFAALFCCGVRISMHAPDLFGKITAFGITLIITLQAAFNIAVVTGCLPTKGLPLPFISYGGSSLFVTTAMIGLLVNIALRSDEDGPNIGADQAFTV